MCLNVLGLNLRDPLVEDRLKAGREVKYLLVQLITNRASSETLKAELIAIREGKRPYTMAARAVLDELESELSPIFDPTGQETV